MAVGFVAQSIEHTLSTSGQDDVVMMMRRGADSELQSVVPLSDVAVAENTLLSESPDGQSRVSKESLITTDVSVGGGRASGNVQVRGVSLRALSAVRPGLELLDGQMPRAGVREVLVGKALAGQIGVSSPHDTITIGGEAWAVAGIAKLPGSDDSALFSDATVVNEVNRHPYFQSVRVRLAGDETTASMAARLTSDKRLALYELRTTRQYFESQARDVANDVRRVGWSVLAIVAVGLSLASLNTTYTVVQGRRFELMVIRVVGFERWMVVGGFVLELLVLSLAGGLLAVFLCTTFVDGRTISITGPGASQLSLTLTLAPSAVADALAWSLCMGFIGGWFPIRAMARVPLASGLARGN